MAYRAKTLRSMSPTTRKVARLIGEQESVAKRLKNTIPEIRQLELDSRALATARQGVNLPNVDWEEIYRFLEMALINSHKWETIYPRAKPSLERLHAELKNRPMFRPAYHP